MKNPGKANKHLHSIEPKTVSIILFLYSDECYISHNSWPLYTTTIHEEIGNGEKKKNPSKTQVTHTTIFLFSRDVEYLI